ncbi:peptide/nickel transport system permease protein [Tamaricihabitans halophyticus]|uniref:Peptide/nickel transport system permease protein n=1 Tax=Tamaricihabitans halophyticus TaxID=1262583 RepID=A0A4R2QSZ2_9PSEU|nr:ABC transporter permease [Tamaricihabitans halophyticus]TCP53020.1 peptide/nickel transport system permease protein [Tamaricihabitans halophyticus]
MTTLPDQKDAVGFDPVRIGAFGRCLRNPRVLIAGGFLAIIGLLVLLAPWLAPADYRAQIDLPLTNAGVLGTDDFGRDVLSRLIVGVRTSMLVAVLAVLVAGAAGVFLGLVAGFRGGWLSVVIMRGIDILLSFPPIVLAIAAVAILGPELRNVVIVIGILYIPRFTRVVYTQVLSLREAEYVQADRVLGASSTRTMFRTVLPNVTAPIIVQGSLSLSFAVQIEAGLSFLGLGAQPPLPSLGTMVGAGRDFLEVQPSLLIFPAIVIVAIVLALNVVGDGLRDVLDPRRGQS